MLIPKRLKYKNSQKRRIKGFSSNCLNLVNGDFGIKSLQRAKINSSQIESARKVITKYTKNVGKVWIRIFPNKPVTKKPIETRMGGGKGNVEFYVFDLKPGRIIYEFTGINKNLAKLISKKVSYKLPFKISFVFKN